MQSSSKHIAKSQLFHLILYWLNPMISTFPPGGTRRTSSWLDLFPVAGPEKQRTDGCISAGASPGPWPPCPCRGPQQPGQAHSPPPASVGRRGGPPQSPRTTPPSWGRRWSPLRTPTLPRPPQTPSPASCRPPWRPCRPSPGHTQVCRWSWRSPGPLPRTWGWGCCTSPPPPHWPRSCGWWCEDSPGRQPQTRSISRRPSLQWPVRIMYKAGCPNLGESYSCQ